MTANLPERIGRYRLMAKLGAGGMGVVYRARDERLQRDVAIKLLHQAPNEASRHLLLQEARASSALSHPGICTVHEVEYEGDQAFIVMELVDGQPLGQVVPAEGLPFDAVRKYGLQIADALSYAHGRGIVHRDIKPSNIQMTHEGRLKVLDFGLARAASHEADVTTMSHALGDPGEIAGTLCYMAPEQLRGEAGTSRSDVWSLGVVLYEMAAGRRPFEAATPLLLSSTIVTGDPRPLPSRVNPRLRKVIMRCLARDPVTRYQDAGQVHAALEALEEPRRRPTRNTGRRAAATRVRSLAVLPLENLSAAPDEEFFADGMTDALITTLAQIGALRVISRTSVMRYKGARRPLPEIARELKVDAIVEGTVARSQGRVRVIAQLIHAATDTHLWAKQYETDLHDILALQGEVARAIADEIQIQLSPQERSRLAADRPVNPAAYEAFLRGRHHWYRRSPDALVKAMEYLQQAISLDPTYALAHAGLADAYVSLGWDLFGLAAPTEAYPRAKLAALKALELDPKCAEAHAALGWAAAGYDWDWTIGDREMRRAIELKPQYGPVHIWYSHFLRAMGRNEESYSEAQRALECDPLGSVLNMHLGWHHLYARQYDRALEQCSKTIELDPGFIIAHVFLGQAYEQIGDHSKAIEAFAKTVELSGRHPTYLAELAHGYAIAGRRDDALQIVDELGRMSAQRYIIPRSIAEIYMGLGEVDEAFAWLEKAFEQRNGWLIHMRENPRYDGIRSDPRYASLVGRMRLP